jgi:acyl-CoA synthetase (NDP forming)
MEITHLPDVAQVGAGLSESLAPGVEQNAAREIDRLIDTAHRNGRRRLYEHEVYELLRLTGGIEPPLHMLVRPGEPLDAQALARITSQRVALKLVSPGVVHKTDQRAIAFCDNDAEEIASGIAHLLDEPQRRAQAEGVLVVEFVAPQREDKTPPGALGHELFVGVRSTREFGPVLAAGLGGTDTEYMARTIRPDRAIARALVADLTPEAFFDQFAQTIAYDLLSGRVRGREQTISDDELLRCFRVFIDLTRRFCGRRDTAATITELEVNPFGCRDGRLIPLDGRARFGDAVARPLPRPEASVRALLEPESIAVLGVSATNRANFGRIILNNIIGAGFDPEKVRVIKDGMDRIDDVACAPSLSALDEPVDLLVVAAGASELPSTVNECVDSGNVRSAVLIPGGAGETEGSEHIADELRLAVMRARTIDNGPVFLGPNSMGLQSRPGRFDTFFIPAEKLAKRWDAPHRGVALVSQSGAFIVRTLSAFESLDPAFTISVGNQVDVTLSDLVRPIGRRPDIHTIGVYAEGFNDLDGLDLCKAFEDITGSGKTVVFYKAGRTSAGRDAAAGHTASLAGDYDVCKAAGRQARALVAENFTEFSQLLEVAAMTHTATARGVRIGALTNAGCESVSMGDQSDDTRASASLPAFSEKTRARLRNILAANRLSALVTPRNPLDLTPMAGERAYLDATRILLEADETDAVLVSCIPATPAVPSIESELTEGSALAEGLALLRDEFNKPIVTVVDAGPRYDTFADTLRAAGFAVLPSADEAIRVLGRVLVNRTRR